MNNPRMWIELANSVFGQHNFSADAFFVHGWGDLSDELMGHVGDLYKKLKPRFIILNGEEHYDGTTSAGFPEWRRRLVKRYGVPEGTIRHVKPARHTLEEAVGFLEIAEQNNVSSAAVISVPQHVMRAFLTDLGVTKSSGLDMRLHPSTIKDINWYQDITVYGLTYRDNPERTTRLGRLIAESARIVEYRRQYEQNPDNFTIAAVSEGVEHLKQNYGAEPQQQ